jgi:CheY-like chemotaxis protein
MDALSGTLMSDPMDNTGASVRELLTELIASVSLSSEESIPEIVLATPDVRIPASAKPETARSILGLILHLCGRQLSIREPITLQLRSLPTNVDVAWVLPASPVFQVVFKNLLAGQDHAMTARSIQAAPDMLVTLLLAQKLAAQMRGRLWVQQDDRSHVSIHISFFPSPNAATLGKESPTVLIIEDTKPIGLLLDLYLRLAGYKTLVATDGITGLEIAEEQQPDLITLDVMMPRKDGWEVLRELKSKPHTAGIPVVIISVLKDRQVGFEFGAADYLPKPVVREDLVACVKRLTTTLAVSNRQWAGSRANPVYLGSDKAMEGVLKDAFPGSPALSIDPAAPHLLDDLLTMDSLPDCFAIDLRENPGKALSALVRLRLSDAFEQVPAVLIGPKREMDNLRTFTSEIVDAYFTPEEFSEGNLRKLFAPR